MKNLILASALLVGSSAFAADTGYDFVTAENGYSYIQINQDMSSFSFTLAGRGDSVSSLSYYTYSAGEVNPAQNTSGFQGSKATGGSVVLSDLKVGDRIGFIQKDHGITTARFSFDEPSALQGGSGSGGVAVNFVEPLFRGAGFAGLFWDDWVVIGDIQAVSSGSGSGRSDAPASGQPLPGVLAVLALAGGVFGAHRARRVFKVEK